MTDFFPAPYRAGSNAIGSFQIGVSPIGSITPFNWQDTVISQYGNSQRLLQMIENFNGYLDQAVNLDAFFDMMWNIDTAVGYGLDVWGRILNISRVLTVDTGSYFGYEEAQPGPAGFNQEAFYAGPPSTSNYALSDDIYRIVLLAKAAFNICDGSIPAINALLLGLFPNRGNCYVSDGPIAGSFMGFEEVGPPNATVFGQAPFYAGTGVGPMTMIYVFEFLLTPVELAIVTQSGVLPTPTGVTASVLII